MPLKTVKIRFSIIIIIFFIGSVSFVRESQRDLPSLYNYFFFSFFIIMGVQLSGYLE